MNPGTARQRIDDLVARYLGHAARLAGDPKLAGRLRSLARFQASRLAATYADLRESPRYRDAVEFFLTDLYGPQDLSARDEQVVKALDKLKRFLPEAALAALARAFELHVLTIELDDATAASLPPDGRLDMAAYAAAYRRAGRVADRERQIALIGEIGGLLDMLAQRAEVGLAIRMSRGPAKAAGYGQLQDFLQRGYDAFQRLDGAAEFLAIIDKRERELMRKLNAGN